MFLITDEAVIKTNSSSAWLVPQLMAQIFSNDMSTYSRSLSEVPVGTGI